MSYLVVLNLGKGDWQSGLPTVIAQLWDSQSSTPMQFTGSLPPTLELKELYQQWQAVYEAVYANLGWRRSRSTFEIEVDETDLTHVSHEEFRALCQQLQQTMNRWLNAEAFRNIDRQLRTRLTPDQELRLIVVADDPALLRLPWCLWSLLEDYPRAEIALSLPEYSRPVKAPLQKPKGKVRILAILGNSEGIDVAKDQELLKQLPDVELTFLVEPHPKELHQQLWEPGWDVLFFAGHSSSQGTGHIQINQYDRLTIEELKYGLRTAIAHGLKLAIFNSCDGLGLARDLADLSLPQVIVMREPVPDRVAQEFLKGFLTAFAGGKSLYGSVRVAREKLEALETDFPCATWLPVICQNPAEAPPMWHEWSGKKRVSRRFPTRRELQTVLLSGFVATGFVMGGRWLGWLQPLELWAFDRLMQTRPAEPPDSRLLVVAITDQDIQAEGVKMRQGSLSDSTLNQLLRKIEAQQPAVIGLDVYRDTPATEPQLATRFQQSDRLIAICKRPEAEADPTGILPPPEVPPERVSFSDFVVDQDGVIRRHLMYLPSNPTSRCTATLALSLQLAQRYLQTKGIAIAFTPEHNLQIGNTLFQRLQPRTSGYQPADAGGGQVLLNYRATPTPGAIAQQVTVGQIMAGQVNPQVFKDRIVMIGVAAPFSGGDYWQTPYGKSRTEQVPGIVLHAQMVSQILSAVLDQRPLLWVWSPWLEALWVTGWAIAGGVLACLLRQQMGWLVVAVIVTLITMVAICWIALIQAGWIPLLPPLLALLLASSSVLLIPSSDVKALRHD
ncbi:MAG: CHASE2 domain-containing protein [Oscillatoriales cyanobacterium C42_A2020_001]|nr:CHASE2 domain-containing protein [Leptolyngbyaceae cyanobacterium C42_A2020_001]